MGAGHAHRHGHGHALGSLAAQRSGARYRHRLAVVLALVVGVAVAELVVAFATGSLALVSDVGHLATDAAGVGMALAAITAASWPRGLATSRTFGLYRLEVLAALANSVLMTLAAAYVLVEAVRRLDDPPPVAAGPVIVVASVGLVVNLACLPLLRGGAGGSLNIRGAYLEVLADTLASAAIILGAALMAVTGWAHVDPLLAAAIAVGLLPRTWRLGAQAAHVLVQAAPRHVDVAALEQDLRGIDGVADVHDLHVWTLTSDMDVASVHLSVAPDTDHHQVLDRAREVLARGHGLAHATVQVEPTTHRGCDAVDW